MRPRIQQRTSAMATIDQRIAFWGQMASAFTWLVFLPLILAGSSTSDDRQWRRLSDEHPAMRDELFHAFDDLNLFELVGVVRALGIAHSLPFQTPSAQFELALLRGSPFRALTFHRVVS